MSTIPPKAKLVEVNLISAQELCKSSNMKTYVVAYINSKHKLVSRIDNTGNQNPTWNDKFIFAVDDDFLSRRPSSCLVFEIYRVRHWLFMKDKKMGVVHVPLENLIQKKIHGSSEGIGVDFLAFNVRKPSGSPQGILNIGFVSLDRVFDENIPSTFLGSSLAIDHKKLMGSN